MSFSAEEIREMGYVKAYGVCTNEDCAMSNHEFQSHHPEDQRLTCVECGQRLDNRYKIVIEDASEKLGIDLEDRVLQKFEDAMDRFEEKVEDLDDKNGDGTE